MHYPFNLYVFEYFLIKSWEKKYNRNNDLRENKDNSGNKRKFKNKHIISSEKFETLLQV